MELVVEVESSYRASFPVPLLSRIKSRRFTSPSPLFLPPRKAGTSFPFGYFTKPPTIVPEINHTAPVSATCSSSGQLRGAGQGGREGEKVAELCSLALHSS